jgi:hypothetical protein
MLAGALSNLESTISPMPRDKHGWSKTIKNVIGRNEMSSAIGRANREVVDAVTNFNVSNDTLLRENGN